MFYLAQWPRWFVNDNVQDDDEIGWTRLWFLLLFSWILLLHGLADCAPLTIWMLTFCPRQLLCPITPLWLFLTNSGLVSSYHDTIHCTHMNFITSMWITSCSHDLWPIPTLRHSQAPTLFLLCNNNPSHILGFTDSYFKYKFLAYFVMFQLWPCAYTLCNTASLCHPHISTITDLTTLFSPILLCSVLV